MELLQELYNSVVSYVPNLLSALIVLVITYIIYRIIYAILKRAFTRAKVDPTLSNFVLPAARITLLVLVVLITLSTAGVPTASLLAVLGAAGLAVSLALKDSLGNIAGGILLLISKPFAIGDTIEVEGITGKVKSISILYTYLNTFDNRLVLVPNGQISSESIINITAEDIRRVELVFQVSYGDDFELAKHLITKAVCAHSMILADPDPFIRVTELANSSVNITCNVWAKKEDYLTVKCDLLETIKVLFDENEVEIPYQQYGIHMIEQ